MREDTKRRKKASRGFRQISGEEQIRNKLYRILVEGKLAFDSMMLEFGKMFAETIMDIEREEKSGPDYYPSDPSLKKWASQKGSVYIGDQKVVVDHPRLRDIAKGCEVPLESYSRLKVRGQFSEELLDKILHIYF